jgi:hypothetical protein
VAQSSHGQDAQLGHGQWTDGNAFCSASTSEIDSEVSSRRVNGPAGHGPSIQLDRPDRASDVSVPPDSSPARDRGSEEHQNIVSFRHSDIV